MAAPHTEDGNKRKGFASLSPERRREMARRGGQAAHRRGTAHQWTREEARLAGQKGGTMSRGGQGKLPAGVTGN